MILGLPLSIQTVEDLFPDVQTKARIALYVQNHMVPLQLVPLIFLSHDRQASEISYDLHGASTSAICRQNTAP